MPGYVFFFGLSLIMAVRIARPFLMLAVFRVVLDHVEQTRNIIWLRHLVDRGCLQQWQKYSLHSQRDSQQDRNQRFEKTKHELQADGCQNRHCLKFIASDSLMAVHAKTRHELHVDEYQKTPLPKGQHFRRICRIKRGHSSIQIDCVWCLKNGEPSCSIPKECDFRSM